MQLALINDSSANIKKLLDFAKKTGVNLKLIESEYNEDILLGMLVEDTKSEKRHDKSQLQDLIANELRDN